MAIAAERLLLETVVGEYRDHPAIWMWNLGNEPDLFAWPESAAAGRAWVRDLTTFVHDIDPDHPVTCGLHVDSLVADNHLRVDDVFAETDVAVMHGYPMYASWARRPLDDDFVPFVCALTSAMCAKPVLAEEWGGCTVPGGGPSQTWEWIDHGGATRTQFMAGEDALAEHVEAVLPKLVDVGATGALLWCFADYAEKLWDRPPLRSGRCDPRTPFRARSPRRHAQAARRGGAPVRGHPSERATTPAHGRARRQRRSVLRRPTRTRPKALRGLPGGFGRRSVTAAEPDSAARLSADVPPCRSPDPARHRRARGGRVRVHRRRRHRPRAAVSAAGPVRCGRRVGLSSRPSP